MSRSRLRVPPRRLLSREPMACMSCPTPPRISPKGFMGHLPTRGGQRRPGRHQIRNKRVTKSVSTEDALKQRAERDRIEGEAFTKSEPESVE